MHFRYLSNLAKEIHPTSLKLAINKHFKIQLLVNQEYPDKGIKKKSIIKFCSCFEPLVVLYFVGLLLNIVSQNNLVY